MKKFCLIIIVIYLSVSCENSFAQQRSFGLGVSLGEPTGLNAKLWTSRTSAFVFGMGWSIGGDRVGSYEGDFTGDSRIHFHIDYLLHVYNLIGSTGQYPVFYGIGMHYNTGGGYINSIAVRFVGGIAYMPLDSPFDFFIEFVPALQLISTSDLAIDSAVGVRYYFK